MSIAKTPYSFPSYSSLKAPPSGHVLEILALRLTSGAEFVVVICGDTHTTLGLPKHSVNEYINVDHV